MVGSLSTDKLSGHHRGVLIYDGYGRDAGFKFLSSHFHRYDVFQSQRHLMGFVHLQQVFLRLVDELENIGILRPIGPPYCAVPF